MDGGVWAVVAAAGQGTRLGDERPKAFARLRGRPLLAESLERLDRSPWIEGIVVAAPPGWEEPVILLAEELGCGKLAAAVTGGASRTESVRAALVEVPADAAAVVVHDAARPLLDDAVLERVIGTLGEECDAAIPGLAVPDTLKRVDGERVVETIDRAGVVAVQTPQAFVADVLRQAYAGGGLGTDCAALVENAGGRVRVVPGDPRLTKVTTEADLAFVESLLD